MNKVSSIFRYFSQIFTNKDGDSKKKMYKIIGVVLVSLIILPLVFRQIFSEKKASNVINKTNIDNVVSDNTEQNNIKRNGINTTESVFIEENKMDNREISADGSPSLGQDDKNNNIQRNDKNQADLDGIMAGANYTPISDYAIMQQNANVQAMDDIQINELIRQAQTNNNSNNNQDTSTHQYQDEDDISKLSQAPAIILTQGEVIEGQNISIRLLDDMELNRKKITLKKGTVLTGKIKMDGARLTTRISAVNNKGKIESVSLKLYSNDGTEGLYIRNWIDKESNMDIIKDEAQNSVYNKSEDLGSSTNIEDVVNGINTVKNVLTRTKKRKLSKINLRKNSKCIIIEKQ